MGLINLKDKQYPFASYISEYYKKKFRKEELKERELYLQQKKTNSSNTNTNSNNSSTNSSRTNRIHIQIEDRPEGKVRVQRVVRPDGRKEIIGATLIESSSNNSNINYSNRSSIVYNAKDKVRRLNVDHLMRGRSGYEQRTFF